MTHTAMSALRAAVEHEVGQVGLNPLARRHPKLTVGQIRSICEGRAPLSTTVERLCDALGLEFYIGPPRDAATERPALPPDSESHAWADRRGQEVTPYPVPMHEGHASERVGFSPNGCAHFGLDFLLNFDLNPKLCEVVEIFDDSMAPEFPAGAAGLVDLRRVERVSGHVSALAIPDLTVRRMLRARSNWILAADNPEFEALPWSDEFKIIGQVVWTSHMVGLEPVV